MRTALKVLAAVGSDARCRRCRAALAEDKIKIGFSQGTMESSWRVNMVEGNKKYAEANLPDVDLIITNGENNASKQVSDVESLIAQGVKTLIISPVTADALTPVVKQAMDAGIPVVTLDRKVNTDVTLHIGADNVLIGKTAGEFVCTDARTARATSSRSRARPAPRRRSTATTPSTRCSPRNART